MFIKNVVYCLVVIASDFYSFCVMVLNTVVNSVMSIPSIVDGYSRKFARFT